MFKKLGSLFVTVLGGLLLVYSATRSLDFISMTLPPDRQILAYFGLAALDGGLLAWIMSYLFGSHGGWQRGISIIMIVIDLVGAVAMFTLDTLFNTGQSGMTTALTSADLQMAVLGLSGIIALNIAATVAHHLTDPEKMKEQAEEEAFGKVDDATIKRISRTADQLAAELAPMMAEDWMASTRARYMSNLTARNRAGAILDAKLLPPVDESLDVSKNGWPKAEAKPESQSFLSGLGGLVSTLTQQSAPVGPVKEKPSKGRQVAWMEKPDGTRERLFCMICREEGKDWDTPKPCKHILEAEGQPIELRSSGSASNAAPTIREVFDPELAAMPAGSAPISGENQK